MLTLKDKCKLTLLAGGMVIFFTIFGLLRERIYRQDYGDGDNKERFKFPITFVAAQSVFYSIFAKVASLIFVRGSAGENRTHQGYFIVIAIFYLMANVLSNVALQYIPYPTQVIGKSAKPIPVMLLGVLIGHKRYSPLKYVFVLLVVVGVFCFMFKDNYSSKDGENPALGAGIVVVSLLFDGLQGAVQDRMRFTTRPTALNYMTFVNVWSAIFLIIGMVVLGEAMSFFEFVVKHLEILHHLLLIVMVGAMGHICISGMITKFGALPASIVTTLRKFFTVLLSVVWYGHNLTIRQWLATVIIFGALLADAVTSKTSEEGNEHTIINEEGSTQLTTVETFRSKREDEGIVNASDLSK